MQCLDPDLIYHFKSNMRKLFSIAVLAVGLEMSANAQVYLSIPLTNQINSLSAVGFSNPPSPFVLQLNNYQEVGVTISQRSGNATVGSAARATYYFAVSGVPTNFPSLGSTPYTVSVPLEGSNVLSTAFTNLYAGSGGFLTFIGATNTATNAVNWVSNNTVIISLKPFRNGLRF